MANDAYPYWIVVVQGHHDKYVERVQAETDVLAHAMVLRTLLAGDRIVSVAKEVWRQEQ